MKKILIALIAFGGFALAVQNLVAYCTVNPLAAECHPEGIQGEQGVQGETGETGADGIDGIDGIDGQDGNDGANGTDGLDGVTGDDGSDGIDGADGADGTDGTNGTFDNSLYTRLAAQQKELYTEMINQGQNMQAGSMAVSAIDFNSDHKGHSIGWGLGTGNTWDNYRAVAGAFGYQYGLTTQNDLDVSFVVKAWVGREDSYGMGMGGVVGF